MTELTKDETFSDSHTKSNNPNELGIRLRTTLGRDKKPTEVEKEIILDLLEGFNNYKLKYIYKVELNSIGGLTLHIDEFGGSPSVRLEELETMPDYIKIGMDNELKLKFKDTIPEVEEDEADEGE